MILPGRSSAFALILTVVLSSSAAFAQEKDTDPKQQDAEVRAKAITLLESLAGQVGSLQSRENRARIASNLAGSLWKHDEQRARALLASVEEDIRAGLQPPELYQPRETHTFMVFLKLRSDTVERISKHDAAAAYAFFKATQRQDGKALPYDIDHWERTQEIELAKQIAAENPELAVELGRKILEAQDLSSHEVLGILRRVARKDQEQARILHKEILKKLKKIEFPRGWEDTQFVTSLLYTFLPPAADETTFRELVNLVTTSAMKAGCDTKAVDEESNANCYWVGPMFSVIQKVDPARASKLQRWAEHSDSMETSQGYNDLNELSQARDVDGLMALASKYPEITREIHARAVMIALAEDDTERARKIATGLTIDPEAQASLLQQIEQAEEWHAITEEMMTEMQQRIAEISLPKDRVRVLLFAAGRLAKRNRKMASKVLTHAEDTIATMKAGRDQTEGQLNLASIYCLVKSDRCFGIMESVVPKLNELVDAAVRLDGFDTDYMRENEWNMSAKGHIGDVLTTLANNAAYFAWSDFDRAVSLASQFDRNEIRLMAQLKLAQGILAGPPKPAAIPNLH